jgi:hypothetical protein
MWWWLVACETGEVPDARTDWGDRCLPADGPASPGTIEAFLDLVDALPGPTVDVPCVLQALERPLRVELTMNPLSAQPAASERSPRVFVRSGDLAISVVPEGDGRPLIELAEYRADLGLSVKAELLFPVTLPLDRAMAFERVVDDELTTGSLCGLCHWDEVELEPGVFASTPLRPTLTTLVPVVDLRWEHRACDPATEPDRCAMLDALFGYGDVVASPFPASWPTIYDND